MRPKISNKERKKIEGWPVRFVKIKSNAFTCAKDTGLHQGHLSDWINNKADPSPEKFWIVENWIVARESELKANG